MILATRVLFKWENLGDDDDHKSSVATSTIGVGDDGDDGDLSDLSGDEMGTNLLDSPVIDHFISSYFHKYFLYPFIYQFPVAATHPPVSETTDDEATVDGDTNGAAPKENTAEDDSADDSTVGEKVRRTQSPLLHVLALESEVGSDDDDDNDTVTTSQSTRSRRSNPASVASASMNSSEFSAPKKARITPDQRRKLQGKWVRDLSIHGKTLGIASKSISGWLRQLHKFGALSPEQLVRARSNDGATNLDLRRLICDAYFMHAAQLRGKAYNVVTGAQVGSIHPGSSLHPNRAAVAGEGTKTAEYPWLVFGELFRSAKT